MEEPITRKEEKEERKNCKMEIKKRVLKRQ